MCDRMQTRQDESKASAEDINESAMKLFEMGIPIEDAKLALERCNGIMAANCHASHKDDVSLGSVEQAMTLIFEGGLHNNNSSQEAELLAPQPSPVHHQTTPTSPLQEGTLSTEVCSPVTK